MRESARISDQLRRSYEGVAWHGPALKEALEGVTAETAKHRAAPDVHTIAEIVAHLSVWAGAVRRYVAENRYVSLSGADDWPAPASDWAEALARLERAQRELWEAAAEVPEERLEQMLSTEKNYSVYRVLHGVVQHNLYHAGQIALLKKLAVH